MPKSRTWRDEGEETLEPECEQTLQRGDRRALLLVRGFVPRNGRTVTVLTDQQRGEGGLQPGLLVGPRSFWTQGDGGLEVVGGEGLVVPDGERLEFMAGPGP